MMDSDEIDHLLFGSKVCAGCGHTFPASSEYFHRDRHNTDGLKRECRRCCSVREAARYRRRKEAGR